MAALNPARPQLAGVPGWLRLVGPAVAVSIGYIDPGNWASDLAAGVYGFSLLWVVVVSNIIALVLQLAIVRLTVATGDDFASLIAARWPKAAPIFWAVFQGAAIATDLAEFTGIVLGTQLLFHLTTAQSVVAGLTTVWTLLLMNRRSLRLFDAAMMVAVGSVALVYVNLIGAADPRPLAILHGALIPSIPNGDALLVVVAIVGATVMPHNLFLHSWLIRRRCETVRGLGRRTAGRCFAGETFAALGVAGLINGAILIVGAGVRSGAGSIERAFTALGSLDGIDASMLFGAALLISGIAASTTSTLAGDCIFAAFSPVRVPASVRRAVTILPAAALLLGGIGATTLLLWSQTALCLVLPVALIPLLALIRRSRSHFFTITLLVTAICTVLDAALLIVTFLPNKT
jgi:manganese transport protein